MNESAHAHEHLTAEWGELQQAWHDSQATWKDGVSSQFEKRFMSSLTVEIPTFLSRLEALRDELHRAHRKLD